eukprot:6970167-Lingulodinium_polyedra.AAC.1
MPTGKRFATGLSREALVVVNFPFAPAVVHKQCLEPCREGRRSLGSDSQRRRPTLSSGRGPASRVVCLG